MEPEHIQVFWEWEERSFNPSGSQRTKIDDRFTYQAINRKPFGKKFPLEKDNKTMLFKKTAFFLKKNHKSICCE